MNTNRSILLCVLANAPPSADQRLQVIIFSEIGGTDFDDFQSTVHLFVYADTFDIEVIISSPYGTGRRKAILQVIDAYERDSPYLKAYSCNYRPPVARLKTASERTAKPGNAVSLSAEGSTDPDGNALSYQWIFYPEPGAFTVSSGRTGAPIKIENADQMNASFTVHKKFGRAGTMHIILAVTDNGTPALTRYQRVIVTVLPK